MKKKYNTKSYKFIRQCAVQYLIATLLCSTATAFNDDGQLLDRELTIKLSNVSFVKALKEIEAIAKVKFIYSIDHLNVKETVSLEVTRQPLRNVLNELLAPLHIKYKVHEKEGSITLRKQNENKGSDQSFLMDEQDRKQPASPKNISGIVTDAVDKQPLAGVNIVVKGTTVGTATDADGKFSIEANEDDVLVFSFIGYTPFEVTVKNQSIVNVELQQDVKNLSEVVVNAGYWEVKEKEQTGNIAKVSAEEFGKQSVNNPLQALQGKMAGVYIQQLSGVPGGSFNIQIRGQNSLRNNSLNNGNRPLYIIDGVPFTSEPLGTPNSGSIIDGGNPLNNINPSDIESVEILKDADATAIYGSRGANGVVLITTKKGKAGKTKFNFNVYQGAGTVASKMNLLNTQQYLEMRNEAFANDKVTPGTFRPDYDILNWDQKKYTDWQKTLIGGTAHITNAQLSVSGGSSNTQFYIGATYLKESTVFPGDFADQKTSANFKLNHASPDNRFKLDFSGYYLIDNNKLPRVDLTSKALTLSPNAPDLYTADGSLNWQNSTWSNPLSSSRQEFSARTTNLVSNTIISYKIIKGLTARVNLGYTEIRFNEFTSQPKSSFDPAKAFASSSTYADKKTNTWISEPQLEYKSNIGSGSLTALVGSTFQASNSESQAVSATGFTSDALLHDVQAASSLSVTSADVVQYRYSAFFGRINYNWQGKYIVNLTGRRDGSSRFGPGKQFANFGAIGAAWIFSQEDFIKLPFLSFGKLRASYGSTGSDQIGDYGYLDLWSTTSYSYAGNTGLYPRNLANPDYGWEINKKLEAGLELGFLEDKINLSLSYYSNHSNNQLIGVPLPTMTGFVSVQANFPAEVENTGIEVNLRTVNKKSENFSWSTFFNFTAPRNKLVSFPNIQNSSFAQDYIVGKPLSTIPSFHYLGVDPQTGLYLHEDVNKDGSFSNADYLGIKKVAQNYYGGLQNTLTYKNFSLDIFFQFVKQTGRNYLTYFNERPGAPGNQPAFVMDRWRNPGDHAYIQQFTQGYGPAFLSNLFNSYSDNRISDASFIRLRSVSLSYSPAVKWFGKDKTLKVKIYLQGQNLFTLTNYLGLDPENQSASLPPLKRITMGLQITF